MQRNKSGKSADIWKTDKGLLDLTSAQNTSASLCKRHTYTHGQKKDISNTKQHIAEHKAPEPKGMRGAVGT